MFGSSENIQPGLPNWSKHTLGRSTSGVCEPGVFCIVHILRLDTPRRSQSPEQPPTPIEPRPAEGQSKKGKGQSGKGEG
eukprot:9046518-Heterocapsa_arctica.AAC.1